MNSSKTKDSDDKTKAPFWKRTWFIVSAIGAVLVGVVSFLSAFLGVFDWVAEYLGEEEPRNFEECLEKTDPTSEDEARIDYWYCDTEFSQIWTPDREVTMLTDNRGVVSNQLSRILTSSDEILTDQSFAYDTPAQYGQLNRLFNDWPTYKGGTSLVTGSVQNAYRYSKQEDHSEWVFQLGTVRDPNVSVYVRTIENSDWSPPNESECPVVMAEITPIARGYVTSATGAGPIDVIYSMASSFICAPVLDPSEVEEFFETLSDGDEELYRELIEGYEKGQSNDRW